MTPQDDHKLRMIQDRLWQMKKAATEIEQIVGPCPSRCQGCILEENGIKCGIINEIAEMEILS